MSVLFEPSASVVGESAWWPAEAFLSREAAFPGAIDITGPARPLTFGPYARLRAGLWRAEATFEVCADAAAYDYVVDFGVLDDFAQQIVRPGAAGRHATVLERELGSEGSAELRFSLARAAFHGRFRLIGVRVTLLEPRRPGG